MIRTSSQVPSLRRRFSNRKEVNLTKGAFFWGYSGYSYSGLGITEYTEFQFRKERSLCFRSGNGIGGDLRTTISAQATGAGGRVGFPAKNFPKDTYSVYSE